MRKDRVVLRISIRPRRAARLAVVAFGGCLALAACGPVQLGSAAIVGGQRITTSTLTTQVADLSNAYHGGGGKLTISFPASQMPQQVLAWLIRFQVRDQLARREGITVTTGDVQRAVAAITAQVQQSGGASLTALAVQNGLPPDLINTGLGRYQAIANALVSRLDGGNTHPTAAQQQALSQQFNRAQCLAAKSLNIKINPQFGRLDYTQLGIVPAANTLSAPGTAVPTPSPSAQPQFSPPC
jgi:lambda repressor-like predicted transcriptional regulator